MPNDAPTPTPTTPLALRIVSDTICPWCYVGKRRFERAVAAVAGEGIAASITWLPYELNPTMPREGVERRAYRTWKFGSWERSQELDAHVGAEAAREGLEFNHDRMLRTPNTLLSHRVIWLADQLGGPALQDSVVEALFRAYFTEGQDIGDRATLLAIGTAAGLGADRLRAMLDGDGDDDGGAGAAEVARHLRWAQQAGLDGVPSVIVDDTLVFSGAQRTEIVAQVLRDMAAAQRSPAS
jgi:predicted DsbA family dithiol-disulfide isomerase